MVCFLQTEFSHFWEHDSMILKLIHFFNVLGGNGLLIECGECCSETKGSGLMFSLTRRSSEIQCFAEAEAVVS